jgi:hypothetical protein
LSFEIQSTSPNGRYQLQVDPWEARNTHWVLSPQLVDTESGHVLFKLTASAWSAENSAWESDAVVRIAHRKYLGDQPRPCLTVRLNCAQQTGELNGADAVPFEALEVLLEEALLRAL